MSSESKRLLAHITERSTLPSIEIQLRGTPQTLSESTVGGQPYLDPGEEAPMGQDGAPLVFLAQLNLAELPDNDLLPATGLLQFFIGGDDLLGMHDFDNIRRNNHRVIYRESFDSTVDSSAYTLPAAAHTPFTRSEGVGMDFELVRQPISTEDHRFEDAVADAEEELGIEVDAAGIGELVDQLRDSHTTGGHRIGGYPFFTQADLRTPEDELDVLLLQIDSEGPVMWGETGVGAFFISAADLRARDFSRVGYSWDCY
ncbi:YwqG family protein [Corynebacterium sp. 11A]|uniref:YwqG family protein n=1 Tax=Corynebacterium sp. 11A TaxID=2080510 RepID=UPI00178C81E7|nr:DUF1963 domain-containing protein [Corynebacterium sp. 11A]